MSESAEEYLEAIYSFHERGVRAKNSELSERLRVAPASVTQMAQRLADEGLLVYEPYRGIYLTGRGAARAQMVTRRHRLVETLLQGRLRLPKEKVHAEACRIEHTLSGEVTAALCKALGNPETCPDDGNPIPPCTFDTDGCDRCEEIRQGEEPQRLRTRLSDLTPGEEARVAFTKPRNGAARTASGGGGFKKGSLIQIGSAEPFTGPMEIRVDGAETTISRKDAEQIYVEFSEGHDERAHPHGPYHE